MGLFSWLSGEDALSNLDEELITAVYIENWQEVEALIQKGANLNPSNDTFENRMRPTPLVIAVENGRLDIVALLLERGANVNGMSLVERPPIIIAT